MSFYDYVIDVKFNTNDKNTNTVNHFYSNYCAKRIAVIYKLSQI